MCQTQVEGLVGFRVRGEAAVVWSEGDVWQLRRGEQVVGEILIEEGDFPWLSGRFVPAEGFAEVKPLFERELELVEEEDLDEWDEVVREIGEQLQLVAPAGPVAEFLLHIDGERAWFRWSDEPFV
ncbi:hypothetical protein [Streptomyces sp. NPDC020996]|uniref:hypothetical protein n=1 Tax=Streptomyces sp. NPDC020996 TaxID=3154791 RepID=UPI0033C50207